MVIRLHNDSGDSIRIVVKQVPVILPLTTIRRVKKFLGGDLQGLRATGPDGHPVVIMPHSEGHSPTLALPGPFYQCPGCGVQGQSGTARAKRWCSPACRMRFIRRGKKAEVVQNTP